MNNGISYKTTLKNKTMSQYLVEEIEEAKKKEEEQETE